MNIFVTGATGFIGSAVTRALLRAGHRVSGLSRSDLGAEALAAAGATVHRGSLEDLESLRSGAAEADAVIHCAFDHDFSNFAANCEKDKRAIEALGSTLAGSGRTFIVSGGLVGLAPGRLSTENDDAPAESPMPRVSEQTAMSYLTHGVGVGIMRLSQIHDTVKQGLITYMVDIARNKGVSAYVGTGENRFAAAHIDDVAELYRLAVENHAPGVRYHAIAEESVRMLDIAEAIGHSLQVPVVSIVPEEAATHFGFLAMFADVNIVGSSTLTQERLGWHPSGPSLLEDLTRMNYAM